MAELPERWKRIMVHFTPEEFEALIQWAKDSRRHPKDQAAYAVIKQLKYLGYLMDKDLS